MTDNIISFPKSKILRDEESDDEFVSESKAKIRQNFADNLVNEIVTGLHNEMELYNVDTSKYEFRKDFIFMMDVIKAIVYRSMEMEHPLHEYIDRTVKLYKKTKDNKMIPMTEEDLLAFDEYVDAGITSTTVTPKKDDS